MMLYSVDDSFGRTDSCYQIASARKKLLRKNFPNCNAQITTNMESRNFEIHVTFLSVQDCYDIMSFVKTNEYLYAGV
jgi:hypothetical protein